MNSTNNGTKSIPFRVRLYFIFCLWLGSLDRQIIPFPSTSDVLIEYAKISKPTEITINFQLHDKKIDGDTLSMIENIFKEKIEVIDINENIELDNYIPFREIVDYYYYLMTYDNIIYIDDTHDVITI